MKRKIVLPFDDNEDEAIDVRSDLRLRVESLPNGYMKQPGLMARYGALAASALQDVKDVKFQLHCAREDLDRKLREKALSRGKRVTEAALANAINRHPKVRHLLGVYREASREAALLKVFADAIEAKKDMLQSLGAYARAELSGELRTMETNLESRVKKGEAKYGTNGNGNGKERRMEKQRGKEKGVA